jgi:HAMP domain-containing protein
MDPATGGSSLKRPKDPNFGTVVAISVVVLLLVFVAAWFLVMRHGRKMVPAVHTDHQPNASWSVPKSAPAPPRLSQV